MGLTLWRFDEYGTQQEAGHYSCRFGRRQNALLGIRESVTNTVINPFFQNTAQGWSTRFADVQQALNITVPVGSGAIHVTVDPEFATGLPSMPNGVYQQFQELLDTTLVFTDGYKVFGSCFVRGAVGTEIALVLKENVTDGWVESQTYTLTKDYEWEWVSAQFTPDAPQLGTVNDDYVFGIGTYDFYVPPFQLTGAQVALTPGTDAPPFVHDENGSIRDAASSLTPTWGRTAGGGNANYTNVTFPMPDNMLQSEGAIAFWQYGTNGTCFMFKSDYGGTYIEELGFFNTDIFSANIDDTGLHVTLYYGATSGTYHFNAVIDNSRWNHYFIQWNRNGIVAAINAAPIMPTFDEIGATAVAFIKHPQVLVLMSNREDAMGDNVVGLQEQFTIYRTNFTVAEIRHMYERGDNLVTGAIGYVSLFEEPVLEVGEAIGFEGPGDYRVEVGGYAPGTSVGQPTVRFESGRDDEGPYIVQSKFPKILEPIKFQVMNIDCETTASKKINNVNRVLKRAGTGQKLVLHYSPIGSSRNLRARVTQAYLNIPQDWTGIAQVTGALRNLSIDIERDNFVGGRRVLGKIYVPTPMPSDNADTDPYGVVCLPPVEGNLPSPVMFAFRHGLNVLGDTFSQPQSVMLSLRRRRSLEEALYVLSATAMDVDISNSVASTTDTFDGGYIEVYSADLSPTDYTQIGTWTQSTASGGDKSKTEALGKLSNFGNYRVFMQARNNGAGTHRLRLRIGDGVYVADLNSSDWTLVDFGTVNFPSKGVLRPNLHGWNDPTIAVDGFLLDTGAGDLHITGVVFMPVDDGFMQAYSDDTGDGITFVDATGEVSNTALISAFSAGMLMSSTTPTEIRVMSMSASGEGYKFHDSPMRLYAECMPTYTGLGDE